MAQYRTVITLTDEGGVDSCYLIPESAFTDEAWREFVKQTGRLSRIDVRVAQEFPSLDGLPARIEEDRRLDDEMAEAEAEYEAAEDA